MNERAIFEAALEIADPNVRKAFLGKAFQGDPDARGRIEALPKSHKIAGSFLDNPAVKQMGQGSANALTNTVFGKSAGDADDSDNCKIEWDDPSAKSP